MEPTTEYYLQSSLKSGLLEFPKELVRTVAKEFDGMFVLEKVQYLKIGHKIELKLLL